MFRIEGLKEMERRFDELADRARALDGEQSIPLQELFPPAFMRANSRFGTIGAMLEAKGIADAAAFEQLPEDEWERFVVETTRFASWEDMKGEGAKVWIASRLAL